MVIIDGNEYEESITILDLSSIKLIEIPLEVFTLINLKKLVLNFTGISIIPEQIKYLTNLEMLSLYDNKISIIPEEIKYLTNLKKLFLYDNKISIIPEEIKYLINLKELYLCYNQISMIPEEIKYLTNLEQLDLDYNKISTIPREIKYLIKLEVLYLQNNKISIIPEEIKYLINLKRLHLHNNQISIIPKEIKYLINLKRLYLDNNQISVISEEIKHLINLQVLYLSNNNISSLPIEIINCRYLKYLYFGDNPIEEIDIRITRFIERMRNYNNHGLFNNSQNIHSSSIQQSTNKSINNLMKDIIIVKKEDLIKELVLLNPKCLDQLIEYLDIKDIHSTLLINFEDLFLRVLQRIILSEHKTELLIRLDDEMSDSMCKCFTGRLTRLVNVLVGFFDDIEINISESERISAIILSVVNGQEMTDELKEICIQKLKEADVEESEIEKWLA
jgi:Leucine-rich repeat (LRR) protein